MAHAYLAFQDVERGALALRGPPKSWREGGRAATLIGPLPSRTDYPPGTPSKPRQNPPGGTVACSRSCAASIADAGALAVSCRTERTGASRRQPRCRTAALTPRGLGKRPLLGVGRRTPLFARAKIRVGVTEWGGGPAAYCNPPIVYLSCSWAGRMLRCSPAAQLLLLCRVTDGTRRKRCAEWYPAFFLDLSLPLSQRPDVGHAGPSRRCPLPSRCGTRPTNVQMSCTPSWERLLDAPCADARSCIRSTTLPTRLGRLRPVRQPEVRAPQITDKSRDSPDCDWALHG